jgi:hypothetical protein
LIQPGGKSISDTSQGIRNLFSAWLKILPPSPKFDLDEITKMSLFTFNQVDFQNFNLDELFFD